ncbi:transglutaminase family protein [Sphingomonas japonica]|uniref:Transglutaminase-like putative cysteine protease n=1 Tax=Sphingomonas japonica TaxID=511662 RepID=A0ABX0U6L1_9SPHN|nr:transglutaminase family protein [Sphingomonas japonica]NIJ24408.1 transglutaminase-like putative cysteine protease [Sphingomonas japonica]
MRLKIHHRTRYSFTKAQLRLVQMLRLTPEDTDGQTVIDWRIDVDRDARLRQGRDGFGNRVTMLYADGPIDAIEIEVSGEVLTGQGDDGIVSGATEPFPPELYLRTTDRTLADDHLVAFLAPLMQSSDPLERLHGANRGLFRHITLDGDGPDDGRSAREAFDAATHAPRDAAHILIAGLRAMGVPARYVWGYRSVEGDALAVPHAWTEAHVAGRGWMAFDPSCGECAGSDHARVAIGLDSLTAAPVAGSRLGPGRERLAVDTGAEE